MAQKMEGLNLAILFTALEKAYQNENTLFTAEEANLYIQDYFQKHQAKSSMNNTEEGKLFLEANKTKDGVVELPSGLQYKVLVAGEGDSPTAADQVRVHYTGTLINGTVFDSSVERGESIVFGVSQVISGWTEALQLMKPGAKWVLYIPSELAYGAQGAGGVIGPNSTLIFEVELLEVVK